MQRPNVPSDMWMLTHNQGEWNRSSLDQAKENEGNEGKGGEMGI